MQTKNVSANQVEVFVENTNYRVYIDLIGETEKIGEYKLYLERINLKPGTYTIVFTVDELKEKINIIIE